MFALAARNMGYRVMVVDPDPDSPAGAVADLHLKAGYTDRATLERLAETCSAVTVEFENVPDESLRFLSDLCVVCPSPEAVSIAQDRIREKSFLRRHGFPVVPFEPVHTARDVAVGLSRIGLPALLKRAALGYDGKGQHTLDPSDDPNSAFARLGGVPCVLEKRVALERELSVVLARDARGHGVCYPVAENHHRHGILDVSIAPARVPPALAEAATEMAMAVADSLRYCGVLAVEYFVTDTGSLLINEIAPRPHNSGHYTLDACLTSQFEQQVRILCGFPPGSTRLFSPAVMVNLLGDLWANGTPDWGRLLREPHLKLHLYGKREARPGRKMGHFTYLDTRVDAALARAESLRAALLSAAALDSTGWAPGGWLV